MGARVALTTVDPDLVNPYTHNWFLGAQREIGMGVVAEFNYLGSSGHNLYNAYNRTALSATWSMARSPASTRASSRSTW